MAKKKKRAPRKWSKESIRKELLTYHAKGYEITAECLCGIDSGLVSAAIKYFGGWNNALAEAGLPVKAVRRWSKESISKELLAHHKKGHVLSYRRMQKIDSGLVSAAVDYFGGWNNALAESGIPLNLHPVKRSKWSKETVKKELREHYEKGRVMSYGRMQKIASGLVSAAVKRFGSWNNALTEAGIPIIPHGGKWSKESVKKELLAYHEKGCVMSNARMREIDGSLASAAERYFGSWNNALRESGIPVKTSRKWSKETIKNELRSHYEKGDLITYKGMQKIDSGLVSAAVKRFGNWNNALTAAGIPISRPCRRWSKKLVSKELLACYEKGVEMRESVMMKTDRALVYAARKYFGNWTKSLVEVGISPEPPRRKWTREKVLRELAAIMKRGESLKAAEVRKKHVALYQATHKVFKDYREAVELLGPRRQRHFGEKNRRFFRRIRRNCNQRYRAKKHFHVRYGGI